MVLINRFGHLIISAFIFANLGWFIPEMRIAHLYIYVGATFIPDIDALLIINKKQVFRHRHWFFHSLIIPLSSFVAGSSMIQMGCMLSIGIHLLLDVSFKTKGGTYCISGLNYKKTTVFLIVNGLISIFLFIIYFV